MRRQKAREFQREKLPALEETPTKARGEIGSKTRCFVLHILGAAERARFVLPSIVKFHGTQRDQQHAAKRFLRCTRFICFLAYPARDCFPFAASHAQKKVVLILSLACSFLRSLLVARMVCLLCAGGEMREFSVSSGKNSPVSCGSMCEDFPCARFVIEKFFCA